MTTIKSTCKLHDLPNDLPQILKMHLCGQLPSGTNQSLFKSPGLCRKLEVHLYEYDGDHTEPR